MSGQLTMIPVGAGSPRYWIETGKSVNPPRPLIAGSHALPGNRYLEAQPRKAMGKLEAEPPDLRYQEEPGNK